MGSSTHSGPIRSGTVKSGDANDNVGLVVLSQTQALSSTSTSQASLTFKIPSGSQLVSADFDVTTAFNGTSTVMTLGSAVAGTQYAGSISLTSTGRVTPTWTAAQLTAAYAVAADTGSVSSSIIATTTPGAGNNTGTVNVTIRYVQKLNTTNAA